MAYPSSVDTGQIVPWVLATGAPEASSAQALTANRAYWVGVTLSVYAALTALQVSFGTGGNGHYDVGIYDSNGNSLATRGSTSTASGNQTYTLATPLPLSPGRYWLAFWVDNATDTVVARGMTFGMDAVQAKSSVSGGLPSSNSGATNTPATQKPLILGILQGGWS